MHRLNKGVRKLQVLLKRIASQFPRDSRHFNWKRIDRLAIGDWKTNVQYEYEAKGSHVVNIWTYLKYSEAFVWVDATLSPRVRAQGPLEVWTNYFLTHLFPELSQCTVPLREVGRGFLEKEVAFSSVVKLTCNEPNWLFQADQILKDVNCELIRLVTLGKHAFIKQLDKKDLRPSSCDVIVSPILDWSTFNPRS